MFLNVEIKARCKNPNQVREYLRSAEHKGTDHQVDTYFNVRTGRLKLREGKIENALIYYERGDQPGPKQSQVLLYKGQPKSSLKEVLTKALGVLAVVDKQRDIYFLDNVKFHVDSVKGLGSFVEIEAIDEDGSIGKDRLNEQCQQHLKALGIRDQDLIATSYSDLVLESESDTSGKSNE
ncbi:MAG: class IV adenylate cyclase [bacterium]|nr:class IV adenylate cyclase [bacterium]MDZ4248099.1 class IV adenylate cyclase [Patescibacteria group bacterium]